MCLLRSGFLTFNPCNSTSASRVHTDPHHQAHVALHLSRSWDKSLQFLQEVPVKTYSLALLERKAIASNKKAAALDAHAMES